MDILTRGGPREFILSQINKSISKLCTTGVLIAYGSGRVRLNEALSPARLNQLLNSRPVPWEAGESAVSDRPLTSDRRNQQSLFPDPFDDDDIGDISVPILPPISLPRGRPAFDEENAGGCGDTDGDSQGEEDTAGTWGKEQSDIVKVLFGDDSDEHGDAGAEAAIAQGGASDGSNDAIKITDGGNSPLGPLVSGILALDETIKENFCSRRTASICVSQECAINLELRRSGELRVFISFPKDRLGAVLRGIGSSWKNVTVGENQEGVVGVQSVITLPTEPNAFARKISEHLDFLEDVLAIR